MEDIKKKKKLVKLLVMKIMIHAMENTVNGASSTFCSVEEEFNEFEHIPLKKYYQKLNTKRKKTKNQNRFSELRENYKKPSMYVDGVLQ